jgi:hypothetical protein
MRLSVSLEGIIVIELLAHYSLEVESTGRTLLVGVFGIH